MDKNLDDRIYYEANSQLSNEFNRLPQRKVLHSRILKISGQNQYKAIGITLFESGQVQKSLIPLKKAIVIRPQDAEAQISLAQAFVKLEKQNEAFLCLQKALCSSPNNFQLHAAVIRTLYGQGKLEKLWSFYEETANMLTDKRFLPGLYYTCTGTLVSFNKHLESLEMYQKAIEADPTKLGYYNQYAMALYHEGLFEEARVQFEHVLRINPENNFALNNKANMQYCQGRVQEAYEEFEYIIANNLEYPDTYSNFLLVLDHLDKDEEVFEKYKGLLQSRLGYNPNYLRRTYQEALRITQAILEKDGIDEETREFNTKKLKGLNLVINLLG